MIFESNLNEQANRLSFVLSASLRSLTTADSGVRRFE